MRKTIIAGQILFLIGCYNKYLRTSPIPVTQMPVDKEMAYIENTDQTDRKQTAFRLILFHNGKTTRAYFPVTV